MIDRTKVDKILEKVILLDFNRKRFSGGMQEFYFHILYENKPYLFIHNFIYHSSGVTHRFRFKKRPFQRNPIRLLHKEYIQLSDTLMKQVNATNKES